MASIQKVKAGRHTYYRIVESRRVNGKPRPVPLLHLGTADQLLNRLLTNAQPRFTIRSYQHGDVAALKAMADRLNLVALMDRHLPPSRRSLSIGTTLVLAAINRAAWPCSKRAWAAWAQSTSLHRLYDIRPEALTSQYFWAQMDAVSSLALEAIEADLTQKIIHDFHLTLDTLFYDTSNFFTISPAIIPAPPSRSVGIRSKNALPCASSAWRCWSRAMGRFPSMPTSMRAIPST